VIAALLAVNTYIANGISSNVLTNTIRANDTWNFYQSKSIKQTIAENARDDALARNDVKKVAELTAKIDRYESDPVTSEGKRELMARARQLEQERDQAKKHSPWLTFAGSALQLSIVLLSASILAVSMGMFYASIGVGLIGAVLMAQGIWLFI
jgi:anti-sigma factor RsiW